MNVSRSVCGMGVGCSVTADLAQRKAATHMKQETNFD
jgi:hypothetical protein